MGHTGGLDERGMDGLLLSLAKADLHLNEPLYVVFMRDESKTFVQRNYEVDVEKQTDVFNTFIRVRALHDEAQGGQDTAAQSPTIPVPSQFSPHRRLREGELWCPCRCREHRRRLVC